MTAKPVAINLINPQDALPVARQLFLQSGKHPLVAAWIETAVVKWLRRDPSSATLVPPGSKDVPEWAAPILQRGEAIHRFALSPYARDYLNHIEDFLAEAVKAARKESNPLHDAATKALRGLTKTSIEQAHGVANVWFTQVARQDDDDTATLKNFKGRREIDAGDGLTWFLALPTDLRRIAGQLENCLGRQHYAKGVREGRTEIWALKSIDDRILVAAHIDVDSQRMVEAKEKGNQHPNAYARHVTVLANERKVSSTVGVQADTHHNLKVARLRDSAAIIEVGNWRIVRDTQDYSKPFTAVHASAPACLAVATLETVATLPNGNCSTMVPEASFRDLAGAPDVQELETCILKFWQEIFWQDFQNGKVKFKSKEFKVPGIQDIVGPASFKLRANGDLDGRPVSWRDHAVSTEAVGQSRLHRLPNGGYMVEWSDRLSPISVIKDDRMNSDHRFGACPDAEAILKHLDPKAERFQASLNQDLSLKDPPVRGVDLWPTSRGWLSSDDLWKPLEGSADILKSDVRASVDYHDRSTEVAAIRDGDGFRPFAALATDGRLYVDVPVERSLPRLRAMTETIREMSGRATDHSAYVTLADDTQRWLRLLDRQGAVTRDNSGTGQYSRRPTVKSFLSLSLVTDSGQRIWGDDEGSVYRLKDTPASLVGIQGDTVVWTSATPRSGLLSGGRVFDEVGVAHLSRYLASSGLRLGTAFLSEVEAHGYTLANGIPVARSSAHLDVMSAGATHRWKRILPEDQVASMPGEDRFWQMQEMARFHSGRTDWAVRNVTLHATPRRVEGRTVAAIEGFSAVATLRNNPALVAPLVTILNDTKMTLPGPILAAIGIRIEDGHHEAVIENLAAYQANSVEHGEVELRWTSGGETNWFIRPAGYPDGTAPLGLVTVSPRGIWSIKLDTQPDDIRTFMADLSEAMHRLEVFPTLGHEAAPTQPVPQLVG